MKSITYDFIKENLSITWDFYDHPLSGLIRIDKSYFIFECVKGFEPIPIGSFDDLGEPDFIWSDPEYTIKSIGSIQAAYHITRQALFKFCVYTKDMGCLDGPKQPWLVKFARKIGNYKSKEARFLLWSMYFPMVMQTNKII